MQCPIDHQPLKLTVKHGHMVHHCADCFGQFLPGNHVMAFQYNHITPVLYDLNSRPSCAQVPKNCPACQQALAVATLDGMELDVCHACNGIWFDANELVQVIRRHGQGPANSESGLLWALSFIIPWPFGGGGGGPC